MLNFYVWWEWKQPNTVEMRMALKYWIGNWKLGLVVEREVWYIWREAIPIKILLEDKFWITFELESNVIPRIFPYLDEESSNAQHDTRFAHDKVKFNPTTDIPNHHTLQIKSQQKLSPPLYSYHIQIHSKQICAGIMTDIYFSNNKEMNCFLICWETIIQIFENIFSYLTWIQCHCHWI